MESPQEETTEPASEHDSEQYPEDDVPEDEGEDDEEEEDDDADDVHYKVIPLSSFKRLITRWILAILWVIPALFNVQPPPTEATQEQKDDEDEGVMPPYDDKTQSLIDGKWLCRTGWASASFERYYDTEGKKKIHILFYDLIMQDEIVLFSRTKSFPMLSDCFSFVCLFLAAQKARDEFNEVERSLREVSDQIRWVGFFFFSINVNAACDSVPISNEDIFTFLFAFVNSNLEKEISFDFGPSGEFAYLYSQCYDLTTSEYVYNEGRNYLRLLFLPPFSASIYIFFFFFPQIHLQALSVQQSVSETQIRWIGNQFGVRTSSFFFFFSFKLWSYIRLHSSVEHGENGPALKMMFTPLWSMNTDKDAGKVLTDPPL